MGKYDILYASRVLMPTNGTWEVELVLRRKGDEEPVLFYLPMDEAREIGQVLLDQTSDDTSKHYYA